MLGRQHDRLAHHFRASAEAGFVDLRWRVAEPGGLRFRLLRSERNYPETSDPVAASDVLWEGDATGYQDREAVGQRRYFYVLCARGPGGDWQEQGRARVKAKFFPVDHAPTEARNLEIGAYPIPPTGH